MAEATTNAITPHTGYVLASVARSGSSWFSNILRSTDQLGKPAEFFNPVYLETAFGRVPADRRLWISLLKRHGATANGIYALKAFPMHMTDVMAELDFADALPDLRFVHWRRRDVLGQAISFCRANQTGHWRSINMPSAAPVYDGQAIHDALRRMVRQNARWEVFFARNGIMPLRLVYEDALADPQAAADEVSRLMSLDARPRVDARGDLDVQRDETSDLWRRRFVAEFGDYHGVSRI